MKKLGKGTPPNPEQPTVYVTYEEYKIIQVALGMLIADLSNPKTQQLPWNPESRKDMLEMLAHARTLGVKIEKVTGIKAQAADYIDGEEINYFTKES